MSTRTPAPASASTDRSLPVRPRAGGATAMVPALSRALTLLERVARAREPMSLVRLATELALPKSSVHGLCNTLVAFGYLRRQPEGGFRIGAGVMGLAEAFVSGTTVAQEFNALWAASSSGPEETVVLSVLSGGDAVYVGVRNSARPLGLAFTVGMRLPAYLTGSGKAMLSLLPADEVRRIYAAGLLTRLTNKGPRDLDALVKELELTRRRGYSVDEEEVREGVCSFGAPVFDASGSAVAGAAVCVNKALLGPGRGERYRQLALDVARSLSERLGARPAAAPASKPATRLRQVAAVAAS